MRKIPARFVWLLQPLVLSVVMTCIVSGVSVARARGIGEGLSAAWLAAWGLSWVVAFPVLLTIMPIVGRIVRALVEPPQS
jgi:Protein of unknown function (DUF2798)